MLIRSITALLLCAMPILSLAKNDKIIHLSAEAKLGAYYGLGVQLGLTNIPGLDTLFLSYGRTWSVFLVHEELLETYRLGMQKMLGAEKIYGFQAELGYASYEGTRRFIGRDQTRSADGFSLAGAFVYQATSSIGLRGGIELHYFDPSATYLPYSLTPVFTLGVNVHF